MRFNLVLLVLLAFCGCKSKKVQPKVATQKHDPRVKKLVGKWYAIDGTSSEPPKKFGKIERDSCLTFNFKRNGTVITEYKVANSIFVNKWILQNDKLYKELNLEKKDYSVHRVKNLSDTLLEIQFLGYKNIFMPFLCDYENMEAPLGELVFGYPYIHARYGESKNAFQDYINEKVKFADEVKEGTEFNATVKINCVGEIVEVKIFGKFIFSQKNEFEKSIVEVIENMPNWNPAVQKLLPKDITINALNKYNFTYKGSKVIVKSF